MSRLRINRLVIISFALIIMVLLIRLYIVNTRYEDAKQYVDEDLVSLVTRFSKLNESLVNDYEWYIEQKDKPLYLYERDLILILQDIERAYFAYGEELDTSQIRLEWFALTSDLEQENIDDDTYDLFFEIHTEILDILDILDEHGLTSGELENLEVGSDSTYEIYHNRWLEMSDALKGISFHY